MATKVEDLVTRREAAELAGVHINTIRLWETTGRVDTQKSASGVVMIPRTQIEAIVESRRDSRMDDQSRIAALEATLKATESELERTRNQYDRLLNRMIELAGGQEEE